MRKSTPTASKLDIANGRFHHGLEVILVAPSQLLPFQTFIVGGLGFLGVVVTLIVNASLARSQREAVATHERTCLRVALKEELTLLRQTYEHQAKDLLRAPEDEDGYHDIPPYEMTSVYQAMLPKIGALSPKEVSLVLQAYGGELQARHLIATFYAVPLAQTGGAIRVPNSKSRRLSQLLTNGVAVLQTAIDSLEAELKGK